MKAVALPILSETCHTAADCMASLRSFNVEGNSLLLSFIDAFAGSSWSKLRCDTYLNLRAPALALSCPVTSVIALHLIRPFTEYTQLPLCDAVTLHCDIVVVANAALGVCVCDIQAALL